MNNDFVTPISGFPPSALLERTSRAGKKTYWRHLLSDKHNMYVMETHIGKPPKNSRPIAQWSLSKNAALFGSAIKEIEEKVIPPWMLNASLDENESSKLALKWNCIAWIVDEGGDALVTDGNVRAHLIKEVAKEAGVTEPWIRTLLTRHFYFGRHPNALMNLSKFKGAKGVTRFNSTKKKMGRPNDNKVLDPDTEYTGRNMPPYYLRIWTQVLEEGYVLGNKSVTECYEILLFRLRIRNKDKHGKIVSWPISPKKLPERALFLRHGSKIIKELELKRKKLGHLEWGNDYAGKRGHSEDLTRGIIEIYDFDGTEFNCEILYGETHAGKPSALFAVDRRSRAIVGWFVWLGRENGYAYKHCLFNAFLSKESWLARYDVGHLTGLVYGVCDQAVFDRGPGISVSVTKALTERIRVDGLITRPREGKGKGVVENIIGILEKSIVGVGGAFQRTDAVRDQDAHKNAEAAANLEFDEFMALLLHAISDHNNFMMAGHLLDADMVRAEVPPNPKAIFMYHRGRRRGDASYEWPAAALYKNLLDRDEVKATRGVVTVDRQKYRADELTSYYEHYNGGPTKRVSAPTVVIYKFAETDAILLWEKDDGTWVTLHNMDRFKPNYEDRSRWLLRLVNMLKNSAERVQRTAKATSGTFSAAKEKAIQAADGLPRKKPAKGVKRANRAAAHAEMQDDAFRSNVLLQELYPLVRPADDSVAVATDSLVGYRKPNPADLSDEMDW